MRAVGLYQLLSFFFMSIIKWQIKIFSSSAVMSSISLSSLCYKTKEPADRPGTVYMFKRLDYQATYISETDRNLTTRLNGHKRATKKRWLQQHRRTLQKKQVTLSTGTYVSVIGLVLGFIKSPRLYIPPPKTRKFPPNDEINDNYFTIPIG